MRSAPVPDALGRRILHQVTRASASSPINDQHLGVVFNHTMQQQGYTTGEIAFQSKTGKAPADGTTLPGLKRLTAGGLYVVRARTPSEFVSLTKQLQARADVAWVEPVVIYGPSAGATSSQS